MSTNSHQPECRTADESRREFSCASEPARRRIRQVPGQGTIYGQASLLDCIADRATAIREVAFGNAVIAHASVLDLIAEGTELSRSVDCPLPAVHHAPAGLIDLPEEDSPLHCRSCARKFAPGQLDYFTGLCAECDEKSTIRLYR